MKNVVKGATKVVSRAAPVLAVASLVSPTLFGLTAKRGLVGRLAKGLVGLTRTKGKIDPRKVTAALMGTSMLETAARQRQAEKALQQEMQATQQWWQSTLTPMQQMTNMLMGYGMSFLYPFIFFPPPQLPQQQQQQQPPFPMFPPS